MNKHYFDIFFKNKTIFSLNRFVLLIIFFGVSVRGIPLFQFLTNHSNGTPNGLGGLFYAFSAAIQENNYRLPEMLPYYTSYHGIPFAYPPLSFYMIAIVNDLTSIPIIVLYNYLPIIFSMFTVIAFYFFSKEIFKDSNLVLFSTFIYAIFPGSYNSFSTGVGIVEALGTLFYIIGLTLLFRLKKTDSKKTIVLTGLFLSLTVLTSPGAGFAFASLVGILFLFALYTKNKYLDSTKLMLVIFISLFFSSPWLYALNDYHGIAIIYNTADQQISLNLIFIIVKNFFNSFYNFAVFMGLIYCISRRNYIIPLCFFSTYWIPRESSYLNPIFLSLLLTIGLFQFLFPLILKSKDISKKTRRAIIVVFILVIVGTLMGNTLLTLLLEEDESSKGMGFLTNDEIMAMEWVELNTDEESIFVVIDDYNRYEYYATDWFPVIAKRTCINVGYGSEWLRVEERQTIEKLNNQLLVLENNERLFELSNIYSFNHVFISKSQSNNILVDSLENSDNFEILYNNSEAIVLEVKNV